MQVGDTISISTPDTSILPISDSTAGFSFKSKNSFKRKLTRNLLITFVVLTFTVLPYCGAMISYIIIFKNGRNELPLFVSLFSSLMTVWLIVIVQRLMRKVFASSKKPRKPYILPVTSHPLPRRNSRELPRPQQGSPHTPMPSFSDDN